MIQTSGADKIRRTAILKTFECRQPADRTKEEIRAAIFAYAAVELAKLPTSAEQIAWCKRFVANGHN